MPPPEKAVYATATRPQGSVPSHILPMGADEKRRVAGAAAQIPYKERALRSRTADIESCACYAVASAQGVGGSRGLACSHSRRAVGGCQ